MSGRKSLELVVYTPDERQREFCARELAGEHIAATVCATVAKLREATIHEQTLGLVDITSRPAEGTKAIRFLRESAADMVIVATGTDARADRVAAARKAGADLYYPFIPEVADALAELLRTLESARTAEKERVAEAAKAKALRTQLEQAGFLDPVTGAFAEGFLRARLEEEISRATRYGRDLALLMIDVDHFTEFVERNGEKFGNFLLRQMYSVIRWSMRPSDCIGRAEDDKFLVILPEAGLHAALRAAEKARLSIADSQFATVNRVKADVTVSVGVAVYQRSMGTPEDLLRAAEAALYQAKVRGKNMVCS